MKKLLLITFISSILVSCQSPNKKEFKHSNEPTVIGYEYNEEGDLLPVFNIFGATTICEPTEIEIDGKSILLMPFY